MIERYPYPTTLAASRQASRAAARRVALRTARERTARIADRLMLLLVAIAAALLIGGVL